MLDKPLIHFEIVRITTREAIENFDALSNVYTSTYFDILIAHVTIVT